MTDAELTFIKRMSFHVEKGLSFEDAGRAVLADDQRLLQTIGAYSSIRRDEQKQMASEISRYIYNSIRAKRVAA